MENRKRYLDILLLLNTEHDTVMCILQDISENRSYIEQIVLCCYASALINTCIVWFLNSRYVLWLCAVTFVPPADLLISEKCLHSSILLDSPMHFKILLSIYILITISSTVLNKSRITPACLNTSIQQNTLCPRTWVSCYINMSDHVKAWNFYNNILNDHIITIYKRENVHVLTR